MLLQASTFHDYEVTHDFADLGPRTMLLNARLVRQSPEKSHIILLAIEDVTERRLLEAEVQKNQRVESLGVLAGNQAAALARLEKIPAIFARGRALTRRLLTFSKGGAPTRSITSLGPRCSEWLEFAMVGADVAATSEVDPSLWLCDCDPGQIGQVVSNLLINARQASPPGGSISLEASNAYQPGPIILTSGHFDAVAVPSASGSDGLWRLAKPFSRQELALVLSSATGKIDISQ